MAEVLQTHSLAVKDIGSPKDSSITVSPPTQPFGFPNQSETHDVAKSHVDTTSNLDFSGPPAAVARTKPARLSFNALPAFDFSPAAASTNETTLNAPRSPTRRTPPAHGLVGHRRNGSEYVGGDIINGGPMLVSTSPKKDLTDSSSGSNLVDTTACIEQISSSIHNARLGPPPTRRGHGHAHKRSGAISSHDLSMILKPSVEAKADSAPTTPSDPIFKAPNPPELDRSTSQPILSGTTSNVSNSTRDQGNAREGEQLPLRTRFSERLEYIPRPLSTISSETSSSMSTIRANHSVANSISSIVSGVHSSPPASTNTSKAHVTSAHQIPPTSRASATQNDSESVSGPLDAESLKLETGINRPSSAPSGGEPSHGNWTPEEAEATESYSPLKPTYRSLGQPSSVSRAQPAGYEGPNTYQLDEMPLSKINLPSVRPWTSPEPRITKRQGKGKSWAGLLSRKAKDQEVADEDDQRRPQTLRQGYSASDKDLFLDEIDFDEDTTCIIESGLPYTPSNPNIQTNYPPWKPRESSPLSDYGTSISVLDIDAAMNSLEEPGFGPSFDKVVGGTSIAGPRRMHSSGTTGGFAGPGMHYHRRTESAPEMDVFDRSRFGFPRLGSNPAMAIEEEEEGEDEGNAAPAPLDTASISDVDQGHKDNAPELSVNIIEKEKMIDQPMRRSQPRYFQASLTDHQQLGPAIRLDNQNEASHVEIVEAHEEPRFSVITKSSDESTITPTLSSDPLDSHPTPPTVNYPMPTSAFAYSTSDVPSLISSPDFAKTSFDGPRMHTANSSITDRTTLSSSRAGDHSSGIHGSIDDVPSLTSSASTMSAHPPRFSISGKSTADRSSSLSAAVLPRTQTTSAHKRLSLASLSRLTGGSYSRSKLNIAESAPADNLERTEKKKGKRISRMMKFWKSKDKIPS